MKETPAELLGRCKVAVAPGMYTLVALDERKWSEILSDPKLSPRMSAPFMILKDPWEVTLLLDEIDFANISGAVSGSSVKGGFRLLSFDLPLDFEVIGFLSEVSRILAEAEVPILSLSAFTRDHVLVSQDHLAKALVALGGHVGDLC